jgi:hypothetical protein
VTIRRAFAFTILLYVAQVTQKQSRDTATVPIVVGTILWALAGLVSLFFFTSLSEAGATWWYAACCVGVLSGLGGIFYLHRRGMRPGVRYE